MRLALICGCEKLPQSQGFLSVSLLKEIIKTIDEGKCEELFYYKGDKKNKKIKDLNTSIYIENFKLEEEELLIGGDVIINIGFYSDDMLYYIYNGALGLKEFRYKDYLLKIKKIKFTKEKNINEDRAIFKTMSPLVIRNKEGRYLSIEDEEYEEALNYIADLTLKNVRGSGLNKRLKFNPIKMKRKVVKEKPAGFNGENYYINAYHGVFELLGAKQDLIDIYKTGLGYRRSEFKGMLDVVM